MEITFSKQNAMHIEKCNDYIIDWNWNTEPIQIPQN